MRQYTRYLLVNILKFFFIDKAAYFLITKSKPMKNYRLSVLYVAIVLCILPQVNAQVSIGVKGGVNFTNLRTDGIISSLNPNFDALARMQLGLVSEIPLNNKLSFRPEITYSQKGGQTNAAMATSLFELNIPIEVEARLNINYFELPLNLKYEFTSGKIKPYIVGGPTLGYASKAYIDPRTNLIISINLPNVDIDLTDDLYQRWEIGGNLGVGVEYVEGHSKIFTDVRYTAGLSSILNDPILNVGLRTSVISWQAGYMYTF